jgi:hypothetical protein
VDAREQDDEKRCAAPMKSKLKSEKALAIRPASVEPWRDPEWQRLWLSLQNRKWRSLAIVPAGDGAPPDFPLRIAVTLARTGMVHLGSPIQVADASKVPLSSLASFMEEVRRCVDAGDLILVALGPITDSPISVSIAQAADAVLLCVLLEKMATAQAKRTVGEIGEGRFVGSAIFHEADLPARVVVEP